MKIDDTILSHCRNLARQVAPELFARRPCYIVCSSIFDGLPAMPESCLGVCFDGRTTFYDFRERIPGWTKPGPVVILFGDAIAASVLPEYFQDAVLGVLLHELAHALPVRSDIPEHDHADLFDVPLVRERQQGWRLAADALPDPEVEAVDNPHNMQFVRIAVHLLGRAQLRGWQISSFGLFGPDLWFLSQPPHFLLPLMKEIVDCQHDPFSSIVATAPPREFSDMWESAVAFHVRRESLCKEVVQ
jgi:hypothetical protein